jgi:hypothetical protein
VPGAEPVGPDDAAERTERQEGNADLAAVGQLVLAGLNAGENWFCPQAGWSGYLDRGERPRPVSSRRSE